MSKNKPTKKVSSKSQKEEPVKKNKEEDLSEYEESFDGEEIKKGKEKEEQQDIVNYELYELPEDFAPEVKGESVDEKLSWFKRRVKALKEMDNNQRLYWIKILIGSIAGVLLGLFGAQTGWWLLLMVGLYGGVTAGGFFLFKLKWNFKEIIFSGFFPYLALFAMFWVLMFTSLYAPAMGTWMGMLETIITGTVNGTEVINTETRTTAAAEFPYLTMIIVIVTTLGLMQFLLRMQNRKKENYS